MCDSQSLSSHVLNLIKTFIIKTNDFIGGAIAIEDCLYGYNMESPTVDHSGYSVLESHVYCMWKTSFVDEVKE